MNKLYTLSMALIAGLMAWAGEVTDVISPSTITITEAYEEQTVTLTSDAVYLITIKDDGNGTPQFKAGTSGIVTKESGGKAVRVEVSWGSKSNENLEIYGQNTPYAASNTTIDGTLLGTIEFAAGSTVGLDIEGDWEFIGITTTANKGKAAQVGSISITWATNDEVPEEPCKGVIINEVCGDDGTTDGTEDWIELYNPTEAALDLSGVEIVKIDEDGLATTLCTIADGTTLAPAAYYVVEKGSAFTSGISNCKPVTISVMSPLGVRLDMFDKNSNFGHNGSHRVGGSYSLTTEGWAITDKATKGADNEVEIYPVGTLEEYSPITSVDDLKDGLEVLFVNIGYGFVMSYDWNTTSSGAVYLYGTQAFDATDCLEQKFNPAEQHLAVVTLCDGGDGTWALKFGDTNNYLNEGQYLACTQYKDLKFKKKDDPAKGTRCTITIDAEGNTEVDYGEGGVIKFNYKGDGTDRFFNYDPTDKPEEHFAITLYTLSSNLDGVASVAIDNNAAPVYYNLQGMRVANPTEGQIVIERRGTQTRKIIVK